MAECCERRTEPAVSIKCREYLDWRGPAAGTNLLRGVNWLFGYLVS